MTFMQLIVEFIIIFSCVYALIGRICKCIEHCATARAYSKFIENGGKCRTFKDVVQEIGMFASKLEDRGDGNGACGDTSSSEK